MSLASISRSFSYLTKLLAKPKRPPAFKNNLSKSGAKGALKEGLETWEKLAEINWHLKLQKTYILYNYVLQKYAQISESVNLTTTLVTQLTPFNSISKLERSVNMKRSQRIYLRTNEHSYLRKDWIIYKFRSRFHPPGVVTQCSTSVFGRNSRIIYGY